MDRVSLNFRIEISSNRRLQRRTSVLFYSLFVYSLYIWPYFVPSLLKFTVIAIVLVLAIIHIAKAPKLDSRVLLVSDDGEIKAPEIKWEGQMSRWSSHLFFVFFICSVNGLTGKTKNQVIFSDQLSEQDKRRLARIIKRIKS